MEVKLKNMSRSSWKRITKRDYKTEKIMENGIKGIASLLHIKEIESPLVKSYEDGISVKIADRDFYWLQIGIENKNYWITAMYDNNKKLVQYYIDITLKNLINYDEESYFYDLFLDVVILPDNKVILLDEEELKQALKEEVINKTQYDLAYNMASKITSYIINNKSSFDDFCYRYFQTLLNV